MDAKLVDFCYAFYILKLEELGPEGGRRFGHYPTKGTGYPILPAKTNYIFGKRFGEKFGGSSEKIVELIFADQYVSASEMAEIIRITERAGEIQLAKLKETDFINRVGPDKGEYCKINI